MSGRKSEASTGNGSIGYAVGYGRPPRHSQFQPGQSGNPAGRRKGVRNLKTDVKRTLATPVKVKEGGRARKKSTQESALMVLREKALRGDARSLDLLLDLAGRFNNDTTEAGAAQPLLADDRAILAAYVAECTATGTSPATAEPVDGPATEPRSRAGKKRAK
jgi:hypothetical protein